MSENLVLYVIVVPPSAQSLLRLRLVRGDSQQVHRLEEYRHVLSCDSGASIVLLVDPAIDEPNHR